MTARISFLCEEGKSPDYELLKKVFSMAKNKHLQFKPAKRKKPKISSAMSLLQKQFKNAIETMKNKRSDFSIFVVSHLEKLLYAQQKLEQNNKFKRWLNKMNELDFQKRTRSFLSKLRKKYRTDEQSGPIINKFGILSRNLPETLKNWSDFYSELYADVESRRNYQTPDSDPSLDGEFTNAEFLDCLYALKRKKSPGFDNITNEDITSLLPDDSEEDENDPQKKISSLHFILKILSDFWFNECVPQDFKRTVLRPFLKDKAKSAYDPANYRPISLLNTHMKIYEALICKRLVAYLENNKILSPFQAAYRGHRSTYDHILTLHEIFLEYRYNKTGPRGGHSKKRLFFIFLDLKKPRYRDSFPVF